MRKSFVEERILERSRAIHVQVPRRVDQMLELVRQRRDGDRFHEIDRARVLVDHPVGIGHE